MQTLDTVWLQGRQLQPRTMPWTAVHPPGHPPTQRRGSHKGPHMLVLSFRRLPGCRGQAKGVVGHKHSCSPVFQMRWTAGTICRANAGSLHLLEKEEQELPQSQPPGQGQPCSLALWLTMGRRMELSLRRFQSQKPLIKEKGQEARNSPHPALEPGSQALTVSASFSLLPGTPEGAPFPAAEARKTPASQTAHKSINLSQSKHKEEPQGHSRKEREKALCFVACSFTGKLHLCLHPFAQFHIA